MKKSFSLFKGAAFNKLGFLPFLLTLLFFAAVQADTRAQASSTLPSAQSTSQVRLMYSVPTGPFVAPATAEERLTNSMKTLKETMAIHAEGSGPYEAAFLRFRYHADILTHIQGGKTVAESIAAGLEAINNSISNSLTPDQIMVEKNAAINLLRP